MKVIPVTSQANPLIKTIRGLHRRAYRDKTGLFIVEGAKLVDEAIRQQLVIKDVLVSQSCLKAGLGAAHAADFPAIHVVDDRQFAELSTTQSPEGILAVAVAPQHQAARIFAGAAPLVVIADAIQDPGNLGTIMRSALAAGSSGIILTTGCVDALNPKVVRSAAGALFRLPFLAEMPADAAIAEAKRHGLKVLACDSAASKPYWQVDLNGPTALLFGNEGRGSDPAVLALADQSITIPMAGGCESLNVGVSAAIILYGAVQQRAGAK